MATQLRWFTLAAGLAVVVGCGSEGVKVPLHPAKGTITYQDGTPLPAGGSIELHPTDANAQSTGSAGVIEDGGKFEVFTTPKDEKGDDVPGVEPEPGAPAGTYKVVVIYIDDIPSSDASGEFDPDPEPEDPPEEPVEQPTKVNPRYESADTTPLEITIKEGGDESIKLQVTK